MAFSWSEVFAGLGEPVVGEPDDYRGAASEAGRIGEAVDVCRAGFASLTAGGARFRGLTGLAVAAVIEGVGGSLDELPPVLASLAQIFATHTVRLQALHIEAAAALVRASARSEAIESARSAMVMSRSAVATLERQHAVARAGAGTDPLAASQLGSLERRLWSARVRLDAAEHAHSDAVAGLALSREEHAALADDEKQLMGATWIALHEIGLGELRDSDGLFDTLGGWAGAAWEWTGGALVDIADGLADAAVALADGRMGDALHHLNDAIDGAIRLTTAIAVVVVVVGATVCPGALAALPALLAVGQALSAAEVGTLGALALSQHPHPETGEPVGTVELVAAAVGAAAGRALGGMQAGAAAGRTSTVQWAALRQAGVGKGGQRVFMRTAQENLSIVAAATAGRRVVSPTTGRVVTGAAQARLVDRAAKELAAVSVRTQIDDAVDDVIVAGIAEALVAPRAAVAVGGVLEDVHPQAEAALDRHVLGKLGTQARSVADAYWSGPALWPARAVYHLVAA